MNKNDLTLAICLYNCEKYIEQTLACITNQSFQAFDLLIVNDCSTDYSIEKVRSFFEKTSRQYELLSFEQNRGIGYARHFAERHAQTKYMIFVDADDLPYPTLVEKLYDKIKSDSDLMAVGCYLEYINQDNKKINGGQFFGEKTKDKFREKAANRKLIFLGISCMYDRALSLSVGGFNVSGFPPGKPRYQDLCEDLDLWTRMSDLYSKGKAIVVIPEILYQYRKMTGTISGNTLGMTLKMRYTKTNLLRRRSEEKELTFIEFYDSLSSFELKRYERDAKAATKLKQGILDLKKGRMLSAIAHITYSLWVNPQYIIQKIKSNSGIIK